MAAGSILLPVDFFNQLDSLLMSQRPLEVAATFAAGWLLYAVLGALAGGFLALVLSGILLLLGRYKPETGRTLGNLVIALVLAQLLVHYLLKISGLSVRSNSLGLSPAITRPLILAVAILMALRFSAILLRLRGFLGTVAGCGALALLLAAFTSAGNPAQKAQAAEQSATQGPRPPIILITIDALAANHMSLYGYSRETTPALQEFAKGSVVFDKHHSNGNFTPPSIDSILTGVRPWSHRAYPATGRPLPTIAARGLLPSLHRAGYRTSVVVTNFLASPALHRTQAWVDEESNAPRDRPDNQVLKSLPVHELYFFPTVQKITAQYTAFRYSRDQRNLESDPEAALAEARRLLSASTGAATPTFLWVHLFRPHDPYAVAPPFLGMYDATPRARNQNTSAAPIFFAAGQIPDFPGALVNRYDEAVRYVDYSVGRFLAWLKQEGRFDDALIIITADHGESFSHSYGGHGGPMLYEDIIRIPLLIKLPHEQDGIRVKNLLTEHADLLPTVLDCLGLAIPPRVEGRSLKVALSGGVLPPQPIYSMQFVQNSAFGPLKNGTVAMLDGSFKYTRYMGNFRWQNAPKFEDSLFDLSSDPGETRNLVSDMPERSAQMRASIEAQVSRHSLPRQ